MINGMFGVDNCCIYVLMTPDVSFVIFSLFCFLFIYSSIFHYFSLFIYLIFFMMVVIVVVVGAAATVVVVPVMVIT